MKKSKLNVNNAADEALKKLKNIYIHIYIYIKLKGSAWGVRAVLSVCNSSSGPHHTKSKNKKKKNERKKLKTNLRTTSLASFGLFACNFQHNSRQSADLHLLAKCPIIVG